MRHACQKGNVLIKQAKKKQRKRKLLAELLLLLLAAAAAAALVRFGLHRYYRQAYPMKYETLIDAACAEKKLDRALVYAVVRTESGFNPQAVSPVGARGLMQLMPDAFDWVRMRQGRQPDDQNLLFDPATNIDCGTEMLRMFLDEFDSPENALCAYHAGRGSLIKWLSDPAYAPDGITVTNIPFADTSAYVKKVLRTIEIYRKLYDI